MAEGISVEVVDGFARIEFLDPSKKGPTLAALLAAGGPGLIDLDSGGMHRTYIVPESVAQQAGLLDSGPQDALPDDTPKRAGRGSRAKTG